MFFKKMSVFKKPDLEKRVEKLEKQIEEILKVIGKAPPPPKEVEEEDHDARGARAGVLRPLVLSARTGASIAGKGSGTLF